MEIPKVVVKKPKVLLETLRAQASKNGSVSTGHTPPEGEATLLSKPRHAIYMDPVSKEPMGPVSGKKVTAAIKAHVNQLCQCGNTEGLAYDKARKRCTCIGLLDTFVKKHLGWFLYTSEGETYVLACVKYLEKPKDYQISILTKHSMSLVFPRNEKLSLNCRATIEKAKTLVKDSWNPEASRFEWMPTHEAMLEAGMVPSDCSDIAWSPRFLVDSRHLLECIKNDVKRTPTDEDPAAFRSTPRDPPAPTQKPPTKKPAAGKKRKDRKSVTGTGSAPDPLLECDGEKIRGAPTALIAQSARISNLAPLARGTPSSKESGWVSAPDALEHCQDRTTSSLCTISPSGQTETETREIVEDAGGATLVRSEEKVSKKERSGRGKASNRMSEKGKRIYDNAKKKAVQRSRDLKKGIALAKQSQENAQPIVDVEDQQKRGDAEGNGSVETSKRKQAPVPGTADPQSTLDLEREKPKKKRKIVGEAPKQVPEKTPQLGDEHQQEGAKKKNSKRKRESAKAPSPQENTTADSGGKGDRPKKRSKPEVEKSREESREQMEIGDAINQLQERSNDLWISSDSSVVDKTSVLGSESKNVAGVLTELAACESTAPVDPLLSLLSTIDNSARITSKCMAPWATIISTALGDDPERIRRVVEFVDELRGTSFTTEKELMEMLQKSLKSLFGVAYASKCLSVWLYMGMRIYRPSPMEPRRPLWEASNDDGGDEDIYDDLMSELCGGDDDDGEEEKEGGGEKEKSSVKHADLPVPAATSLICGLFMGKGKQPCTKIYNAIETRCFAAILESAKTHYEAHKDDLGEAARLFLADCLSQSQKTFGECNVVCAPKKPAEKELKNIIPGVMLLCWLLMKSKQ